MLGIPQDEMEIIHPEPVEGCSVEANELKEIMKLTVLILSILCMNITAMNVTTLANFDKDQEKTDFLNKVAACSIVEHEHCQNIKANLPMAYTVMCRRPQDSYANFLCDVIYELNGQASSDIILELLECQGGNSVAVDFTVYKP